MLAIFSDAFRPKLDGVSVSVENTTREYDRIGYKYHLYAPKTPGKYTDNDHTFRFSSVPLFMQPEVRISVPVDIRNVHQSLRHKYSHIHSHTPGPLGMMAWDIAKLRGIPHFHTFHTYFPDYTHYVFNGHVLTPEMATKLSVFWVNRMDYIMVPSTKVKTWLTDNGVDVPVKVIPNGIDRGKFSPNKSEKEDYLVEQGWVNTNDTVLLYVGRIAKEKKIDVLISYFINLNAQFSGYKLIIVGDGTDLPRLRSIVQNAGIEDAVVFTGYIHQDIVPKVYRAADVFCFMSTSETQGMVVAEALACGVPVIVADDSAYYDIVKEGDNGFIVDSSDGFIRAINLLFSSQQIYLQFADRAIQSSASVDLTEIVSRMISYFDYGISEWETSPKNYRERTKISFRQVRTNIKDMIEEMRQLIE